MTEATAQRPQGAPCWVSLLVHSLQPTTEFYGGLFGWEFQTGPTHFGPYLRATLDGRLVAGIGESPEKLAQPVAWTTYLSTPDADLAAESIRADGGTVAVGPLDASDEAGRLAIVSDPDGAVFGLWQPDGLSGTGVHGEPGALAWNELVTRETSAAAKFYAAVFDLDPRQAPDGDHVTLHQGGRPLAGIEGVGDALPHDTGARWTTYFAVADTDAAARRAGELGGRVLRGPWDARNGRVAEIADPQGAVFRIIAAG